MAIRLRLTEKSLEHVNMSQMKNIITIRYKIVSILLDCFLPRFFVLYMSEDRWLSYLIFTISSSERSDRDMTFYGLIIRHFHEIDLFLPFFSFLGKGETV